MRLVATIFAIYAFTHLFIWPALAHEEGETDIRKYAEEAIGGEVDDKAREIEELQKKVTELQGQAQTLAGQIATYDSQIQLTALKISQTEVQIRDLSTKINVLEYKLQERSQLLEVQIQHSYKEGGLDPLQVIFSAVNVSEMISKLKYLQIAQNNNRKFLHDTQVVQTNYSGQKDLIAESQKKLQAQKVSLTTLRAERDNLLVQTKNNEATYQKQLERARLELEAIQRALISAKKEGPIKKGDAFALVGNSGYPSCSTGKHLHFEVRQGDSWVNAESYVIPGPSYDGTAIGGGGWDWPLKGDIRITQRYGKTPYSYVYTYSGGIHTGIDMVSTEDVIYAPADGTLYSYTTKCGSSNLNIKYIDHGGDIKTFYLHVQ
jgi:peptidoglycan hydrolase CwlO-like protein